MILISIQTPFQKLFNYQSDNLNVHPNTVHNQTKMISPFKTKMTFISKRNLRRENLSNVIYKNFSDMLVKVRSNFSGVPEFFFITVRTNRYDNKYLIFYYRKHWLSQEAP